MTPRPNKTLLELRHRLPAGELLLDRAARESRSGDKWLATRLPDAVALPRSTRSVAAILRFAQRRNLPVTPRGAGHGYVGGCVPSRGGIVLSLERMDRIREIDPLDFVALVQPGVITQRLQDAVEKQGLYYPPDPASRADCSIGGNIATNAGGPRCLKYGVTRDYVLGVEVVLADGSVVRLGSRTHKNKTGFDLARLFVGSEGLLGVVTEATLKLLPLPPFRACLGVGFGAMKDAARAIRAIFAAGILPSALEIADAFTLAAARKRTGSRILAGCRAHIIVELDGQERSVRWELGRLERIVRTVRPVFVQRGFGAAGCEGFWQLRREFSYALRDTGLTKLNEDIAVPRGR
ncbi:MAG: FAD-binding protein, partial [Verrucomicrobia bacterium]